MNKPNIINFVFGNVRFLFGFQRKAYLPKILPYNLGLAGSPP